MVSFFLWARGGGPSAVIFVYGAVERLADVGRGLTLKSYCIIQGIQQTRYRGIRALPDPNEHTSTYFEV